VAALQTDLRFLLSVSTLIIQMLIFQKLSNDYSFTPKIPINFRFVKLFQGKENRLFVKSYLTFQLRSTMINYRENSYFSIIYGFRSGEWGGHYISRFLKAITELPVIFIHLLSKSKKCQISLAQIALVCA